MVFGHQVSVCVVGVSDSVYADGTYRMMQVTGQVYTAKEIEERRIREAYNIPILLVLPVN